jgi:hypothetical protein
VERRPTLSVLRLVYTTTLGAQVYATTQDPSTVSGLRVQAPVSGLLLRYKRPPGPGTSLRTTPIQNPAHAATYGSWAATSDKGLKQRSTERPCTSRSSLYGYLRIYCCKRLHALALLSRRRPLGPSDYSVTTALATQVYFFSNKFDCSSTVLLSSSLNGTTTAEYDYSLQLHDGTPHSKIAATSTH